jgi:hypothetical protein
MTNQANDDTPPDWQTIKLPARQVLERRKLKLAEKPVR